MNNDLTPQVNQLQFTTNWNNKLHCKAFTTLRLLSPRYNVGNVFDVRLRGDHLGNAQVVCATPIRLKELTDHICYLDTGYNAEHTRGIIRKMYANSNIDFTHRKLVLVTLVYMQQANKY